MKYSKKNTEPDSTAFAVDKRDHPEVSKLELPLFLPPMDSVEYEPSTLVITSQQNNNKETESRKGAMVNAASAYMSWDNQHRQNLWDDSTKIPQWMKRYFDWHTAQRQRLSKYPNQWENERVLIMQCFDTDEKCGGTADRLKPLPMFVRLAHTTNRLLLILWSRPAKLEEFLVPPKGMYSI